MTSAARRRKPRALRRPSQMAARARQQMRSTAGWRVNAAPPQSAPSSQPRRAGQPKRAARRKTSRASAQRSANCVSDEEDAHPVDHGVGGRECSRGNRTADVLGPDLSGYEARDENEPGSAGERDQPARPTTAPTSRARPPRRDPRARRGARATRPAIRTPRRLEVSAITPAATSTRKSTRVAGFHGSSTGVDGRTATECSAPIASTAKSGGVEYS